MMPHVSPVSRYVLWLLLFGYFVLGVLTLTSGHGWGDDWAQYVLHAQNIINGRAYGDTGYLFNPDNPSIGSPNYPPGLPCLLAPVIALFGFNIVALKIACFACVVAALPLIFNLLSAFLADVVALDDLGSNFLESSFKSQARVIRRQYDTDFFSIYHACASDTAYPHVKTVHSSVSEKLAEIGWYTGTTLTTI